MANHLWDRAIFFKILIHIAPSDIYLAPLHDIKALAMSVFVIPRFRASYKEKIEKNDEHRFSIIHVLQYLCCIILPMAEWMHARGIIQVHIRINERFCANQDLATMSCIVLTSNDEKLCTLSFALFHFLFIRINKRYCTKHGHSL